MTKSHAIAFFSEEETICLGKLLVAVAKEQPISISDRRLAAMLFIKMEDAINTKHTPLIRPALSPIRNKRNRRR